MGIDYQNKRILITGGSKGIGREIVLQLAQKIGPGGALYVVARSKQPLEQLKKDVKSAVPDVQIETLPVDVKQPQQIKKAIEDMVKKFKGIDGLIANAGSSKPQYFKDTEIKDFEQMMQVDYLGSVYVARLALPYMSEGGFMSFTSSVVGFMGVFGFSTYAGPKFALFGFAETIAQELASQNIHIAVLAPPDTDTPGYENENKTKPYETAKLSEAAKLMSAEKVAAIFLKKLSKKKFVITVNFESALYYRLHGIMPGTVRKIMHYMIKNIRKKAEKNR